MMSSINNVEDLSYNLNVITQAIHNVKNIFSKTTVDRSFWVLIFTSFQENNQRIIVEASTKFEYLPINMKEICIENFKANM